MTRLDDCFLAGEALINVGDAVARFSEMLSPATGTETVPLRGALGRIVAQDLTAGGAIPPHDNSAVDGFAIFFDDLKANADTRLAVTGRIAAGHPLDRPAKRGEALTIFTGAPVPEGPDTIFMVEDCRLDGDDVILPAGIKRGANRRRAGEDVKPGQVVVTRGTRLRPQEVGMAAARGRPGIPGFERLHVAVFSTGDEVRDPSDEADDGSIFDINRYSVMGMLEHLGAEVSDLGIFADELEPLTEALGKAAADHHVLITSGGVSMGAEDHVRTAVEALGSLHFWKLAIKPGRPIALGTVGDGAQPATFIGLPGNPVAAMVTFLTIARPILLLLSGAARVEPERFSVAAGFDFEKKVGRREWLRARLQRDGAGRLVAVKYAHEGSGILSSMVFADGLVELDEERETVKAGDAVDFLPFAEVM
jgi:molybdopterin molybdotransferase